MNFRSKSSSILLSELKDLVAKEREILTQVLRYLTEVERRRLHLEAGYPSLFEFATRDLGYSASAAYRRIQAMRLLKTVPDMEDKIVTGELSLSVASQAEEFFRKEVRVLGKPTRTIDEKREIVTSLLGSSSRECERKLAELAPEMPLRREREEAQRGRNTLIQFTADEKLYAKLEQLKGLLAHQNFEGSYAKLFDQMADIALKALVPSAKGTKAGKSREAPSKEANTTYSSATKPITPKEVKPTTRLTKSTSSESTKTSKNSKITGDSQQKPLPTSEVTKSAGPARSRYLTRDTKRAVWARDKGVCTFVSRHPLSDEARKCGSTHALQYDHIHPHAWGGANSVENITLRCGAHNRYRAERMGVGRESNRTHRPELNVG